MIAGRLRVHRGSYNYVLLTDARVLNVLGSVFSQSRGESPPQDNSCAVVAGKELRAVPFAENARTTCKQLAGETPKQEEDTSPLARCDRRAG